MKKTMFIMIMLIVFSFRTYGQKTVNFNYNLKDLSNYFGYINKIHSEIEKEITNGNLVVYSDSNCSNKLDMNGFKNSNLKSYKNYNKEIVNSEGAEQFIKILNNGILEVWSYFDTYYISEDFQKNSIWDHYFPAYYIKINDLRKVHNEYLKSILIDFFADYLYSKKQIQILDFSGQIDPYLEQNFFKDLSFDFVKKAQNVVTLFNYNKITYVQKSIPNDSILLNSCSLAFECKYKFSNMNLTNKFQKIGFNFSYGPQNGIIPNTRSYLLTTDLFFKLFDHKLDGLFRILIREAQFEKLYFNN